MWQNCVPDCATSIHGRAGSLHLSGNLLNLRRTQPLGKSRVHLSQSLSYGLWIPCGGAKVCDFIRYHIHLGTVSFDNGAYPGFRAELDV